MYALLSLTGCHRFERICHLARRATFWTLNHRKSSETLPGPNNRFIWFML